MNLSHDFTSVMDHQIEGLIRAGAKSWVEIGDAIGRDPGVIRHRVERTLRRHDLIQMMRERRAGEMMGELPEPGTPRPWGGDALPPGHSVTWGAITDGTSLEGLPFQGSIGR